MLLGTLGCASHASWFDDDPPSRANDLRYGAALYNFYLDKNLQALSELMVAEERGGIQGHGDNPEIMAGGFYLAYGMKEKASDIFERLLNPNRPVRTRDAAWFYVARLRYLQGDYEGAFTVLSNLSDEPHKRLAVEAEVLKFNVAVQMRDLEAAKVFLDNKTLKNTDWMPYLYFNLGAGYGREQLWPQAAELFETLTSIRERSSEHLALYDKAMTAEGYAHLFNKNYPAAMHGFSKVRLDSPLASRALLGYGWAAYEQEDYNQALKPWQVLAKRELVDENVQEAWIAIPTVYEKLGFESEALANYRTAEAAYGNEIRRLDQTLAGLEGNAIRNALNIDRSQDFDWLDYAARNKLAPELVYLIQLFSKETFLRSVQEIRDLLAVQTNLLEWQQKLEFYTAMLDEREANRANEVDFLANQELDDKINALVEQRDYLTALTQTLESDNEFLQLVSLEQTKRRDRVLNAEKHAQILLNAGPAANEAIEPERLAALAETARIHKGVLIWQSAEMNQERLTRAKRQLAVVNETLDKIQTTKERLEKIVSKGFDLAPYRLKIAAAEEKLAYQTTSVEIAIVDAQNALRDQVRATLLAERARLMHYLGQARLAEARLLDKASQEILGGEPVKADPAVSSPSADPTDAQAQDDAPEEATETDTQTEEAD